MGTQSPNSSGFSSAQRSRREVLGAAALGVALFQTGCLGLASNLMHGLGVDREPAEYKDLKNNIVAVITVSDSSKYTKDTAANELSRMLGEGLVKKVKGMKLVRQDKIDRWRDINGWDALEFTEMGASLGAKKVLQVQLTNMKLRDGVTLYRGRADVSVEVIDVATDTVEFTRQLDEFTYPKVAGQPTSETTEDRFRRVYLSMLANEIARSFHPYDLTDRFAIDSAIASQ